MTDNKLAVRVDGAKVNEISPGLFDLVKRCYIEKPKKQDLRELQGWLDSHPELWTHVFDLVKVIRGRITDSMIHQLPAQMAIESNIEDLKKGMGYDQAPMIERLLIDNVINAWMRFQWAELNYTSYMADSLSLAQGEYWQHVLGAAQRRYLYAIETLARVRRITRATMQINIAEPGSQQVNIAGDYLKES